jgi:hypothetical protein
MPFSGKSLTKPAPIVECWQQATDKARMGKKDRVFMHLKSAPDPREWASRIPGPDSHGFMASWIGLAGHEKPGNATTPTASGGCPERGGSFVV